MAGWCCGSVRIPDCGRHRDFVRRHEWAVARPVGGYSCPLGTQSPTRGEEGAGMTSSEPGPLAEEAARLVGAAQDWLHRVVADPDTARIATGAPECCWCPLCQLIATL